MCTIRYFKFSKNLIMKCKICFPGNCDTPSNITNGFVTLRTTKEALVADYSCEAGYVLIGNKSITCNSDGKWTETANICG